VACPRDAAESRIFPIDDTEGGCDDPILKKWTGPYPWKREHPAIDIVGFDGVSDNGQEIYNFCKQEGITNIALMGVHTNICILNRSFGIRQMTQLGFQVVLARDLTDAMYDPRTRPFVSHARGVELVIEHIEAKWCPTTLSDDLTRVVA
jgi:nicotinamidase-related amidase